MKYMPPDEMIKAAEALKGCLEEGQYEDAQQWLLEIHNGLFGLFVGKHARLVDGIVAATDALRRT